MATLPIAMFVASLAVAPAPVAQVDGAGIQELRSMVRELQGEVAELKAQQHTDWITQERADQIRLLVRDILADADTRIAMQGDGSTAGWNRGFFVGSADGNWKLKISGQIQARWMNNDRDAAGDTSGFEQRRTKIRASGHVMDPSFTYKITATWNRGGGSDTEDAWVAKDFGNGWQLKFGQWKAPFLRESIISSGNQLQVERSVVDNAFTYGWTQGVGLGWSGETARLHAMYTDGPGRWNTPALDADAQGDAIVARLEFLLGDAPWKDFGYLTSRRGGTSGAMLGLGIEWLDSDTALEYGNASVTESAGWTVDYSLRGDGWNLLAYGVWTSGENAAGAETDAWGAVLQAGTMISDNTELFASYKIGEIEDATFTDGSSDLEILTVGFNHWPVPGNNAVKWTTDFGYALEGIADGAGTGSASADWGTPGNGWLGDSGDEDGQCVLRTQLQFLF